MEMKFEKLDGLFLFLCLLVGVLAEESFFRGQIGVSYFVFIVVFYSLFFWRFRTFPFTHQRLGYLVLIVIWILAAGYYLYDTKLFLVLNILVIPALVIFHLVLITSRKNMEWCNGWFIAHIVVRMFEGIRYNVLFVRVIGKRMNGSDNEKRYDVLKKILIGILISVPFLFLILHLLSSADAQFERILGNLPHLLTFRGDYVIRFMIILVFTFSFFGFLQVLRQKNRSIVERKSTHKPIELDGIISLTILILLDLVYVVFVAVQFKYFFSGGSLGDGFTYAEYARRGFFELLFVTMMNLMVITGVIHFTNRIQGLLKRSNQIALTLLVLSSSVLLTSAFMRMTMYEEAYGFTFLRVLVHSFMIFLIVILAYTLVRIWLEKLSLLHFYFIASLIYYAGMNIVSIDEMVVDQNIARYEQTGKIDLHYLKDFSSTGVLGLIELYKRNPDVPGLRDLLQQSKIDRQYLKSDSWQTYNRTREKVYAELGELEL